jgi:hypothetical protein
MDYSDNINNFSSFHINYNSQNHNLSQYFRQKFLSPSHSKMNEPSYLIIIKIVNMDIIPKLSPKIYP